MNGEHDMFKIPFYLLPASWGLKGKSRAIAEAEYKYSGYELDRALATINFKDDLVAQEDAYIDIELKYNKIDQYEADRRKARNILANESDEKLIELAMLNVDLKHNRISQQEYDRKSADLTTEPYIAMPKISWDPVDPSKTYCELDYNEHFITYLESNGYKGSEEDIINKWLNDICNSILDEMAINDQDFVRTIKSVRRPDGKIEHS